MERKTIKKAIFFIAGSSGDKDENSMELYREQSPWKTLNFIFPRKAGPA
jgi:hypothetical protein